RYFTHNNVGLLTNVSNSIGIEQVKTFDLLNRPVYVTDANGVTLRNTCEMLRDGMRAIQWRNQTNGPLYSYTWGNDLSGSLEGAGGIGGLLARSDSYVSGSPTNHSYYMADGNGNVTYLLNHKQSLVESYRYDPFGNLLA